MRFRGIYGWLSNMRYFGMSLKHNNSSHLSSENIYQSAKGDDDDVRVIAKLSPVEAKRYWRTHKPNRIDRLKVMAEAIAVKFNLNRFYFPLLLLEEAIIEDNDHKDKYWGRYKGKGSNHLGKIITEFRLSMLKKFTITEQFIPYPEVSFTNYRKVVTLDNYYALLTHSHVLEKDDGIETLVILRGLESKSTRTHMIYETLLKLSKYKKLTYTRITHQYVGTGDEPPIAIAETIRKISIYLEARNYTWRGGSMSGSEYDFNYYITNKVTLKEIGKDEASYKKNTVYPEALAIAKSHYPNWDTINRNQQYRLGKVVHQLLGRSLTQLPDFVICYTEDGAINSYDLNKENDMVLVLNVCEFLNIKVYNLGNKETLLYWRDKVDYINLEGLGYVDV